MISKKLILEISTYIDNNYNQALLPMSQASKVSIPVATLFSPNSTDSKSYSVARSSQQPFPKQREVLNKALPDEICMQYEVMPLKNRKLEDLMQQVEESFATSVLRLIDEKGMTDVEVYKRAELDRRLFSKIRSNPNYSPRKHTAIALAFGLQLNLDETKDLLSKAGYALSHSNKADIIVEFFIMNHNYSLIELNDALETFEQPLIGA